jgi:hypothetical protein
MRAAGGARGDAKRGRGRGEAIGRQSDPVGSRRVAVYVDEALWEFRGRMWCHLTADSVDELHAFAADLGIPRRAFQSRPGRPWVDHYDLPESHRDQAVACGAVPLTFRDAVDHMRERRRRMAAR